MLRSVKDLQGYKLAAKDGSIGEIEEFYFDEKTWAARYLVAETGTWLIGRQVLLSPEALGEVDEAERALRVNLTKDQIEHSPPIDSDQPVSRQYEAQYYHYYGWPGYWGGIGMGWNPATFPESEADAMGTPIDEERAAIEVGDPHLRSTDEVTGYRIHAKDHDIGHVEDFIVDDVDWHIRYLVIDTGHWFTGKKVLLSPPWIVQIDWAENRVTVDLPRDTIEQAPEYNGFSSIDRDYEGRLFRHYKQQPYWE